MAPLKKLTRREIKERQSPWITKGIIKSMKNCDLLYKKISCQKSAPDKAKLFVEFKHNLLTTLIRNSKINYYTKFFEDYKNCAKKNLGGYPRNCQSFQKKSFSSSQDKDGLEICDNNDIADAYNDFFVNIGNSVEQKNT